MMAKPEQEAAIMAQTKEERQAANREAVKKHYKEKCLEFKVRPRIEEGEQIKTYAQARGMSVQSVFLSAVREYIHNHPTALLAEIVLPHKVESQPTESAAKWAAGSGSMPTVNPDELQDNIVMHPLLFTKPGIFAIDDNGTLYPFYASRLDGVMSQLDTDRRMSVDEDDPLQSAYNRNYRNITVRFLEHLDTTDENIRLEHLQKWHTTITTPAKGEKGQGE